MFCFTLLLYYDMYIRSRKYPLPPSRLNSAIRYTKTLESDNAILYSKQAVLII